MNPPWITLWNKTQASIGNDAGVMVAALDSSSNPYVICVTVQGLPKAVGLSSIVRPRHDFGNVKVVLEVKDDHGSPVTPVIPTSADELARSVRSALEGNRWYRDVVVKGGLGLPRVYPVFGKGVVQFFNDDLSDLHSNYNGVAAAVFAEILASACGRFGLSCSTDTS
jgi:hypothetical protein